MTTGYVIDTERIRLRELTTADAAGLHRVIGDPETMQYYPEPYSLDMTVEWLERNQRSYVENGFGLWALILKEGGHFIGQCGISLQDIDGLMLPEIGYQIHRDYWNRGYATEAATSCLEYGFEVLALKELFIHTWVKNIPSQRVAEKIGMKKNKEYNKHLSSYDLTWPHVVFSLTAKQWSALKK